MCGHLSCILYWGPATQACALTGNQTGDPLVHRPGLNLLSYTSQGSILISDEIMVAKGRKEDHLKGP